MKKTYIEPTTKTVKLKNRAALLSGSPKYQLRGDDASSSDGEYYDDL